VDERFEVERGRDIRKLSADESLQTAALALMREASAHRYSYNFNWLGLPIIQHPDDIVAVQEVLWRVRPRLVIETGVARGGSLMLSASLLELIGGDGLVVGIDIDIRPDNRRAIEEHPLAHRIVLIEGSSTESDVIEQVQRHAESRSPVLVFLDSMHTHAHVLAELEAYSPLVVAGSYVVVFDTAIADFPPSAFSDRPWGPGDNPRTAVHAFLKSSDRFQIDHDLVGKLLLTVARDGFLRCIR